MWSLGMVSLKSQRIQDDVCVTVAFGSQIYASREMPKLAWTSQIQ